MSLRSQAGAPNHESRPLPRDNKKFGLLKQLCVGPGGITFRNRHSHSSDNVNRNLPQINIHMHSNSASSVVTSSSCNSLDIMSTDSSNTTEDSMITDDDRKPFRSIVKKKIGESIKSIPTFSSGSASNSDLPNIMHWMQHDCPKDVVLLVLAFTGPQKIAKIGRINRFWHQIISQESTWRHLCESLYKWKEGDKIPSSWKKYYQYNPCVPIDYYDIHTALNEAIRSAKQDSNIPREVRVFLRPGTHVLQKAIIIDYNDPENHSMFVTIETMACSHGNYYNDDNSYNSVPLLRSPNQPKKKLKHSIKKFFGCTTIDVEDGDDGADLLIHDDIVDIVDNTLAVQRNVRPLDTLHGKQSSAREGRIGDHVSNRATLVLSTRRQNEPLFRVRQGFFSIRNIDLKHGSFGNDIWNGNSAIQIQPMLESDDHSVNESTLTVTLDSVDVSSSSGRGIVNIDGGHVKIKNSYVHDCAATGIYIGGSGSRASIERSDVICNGKGNERYRRGIAAGHSGIYLEQGHASIIDCNISRNTLTGISAISRDNTLLDLQKSDLISNGTFQLEMPDVGSPAYMNSVSKNNNFASTGTGRYRSEFFVQ